MKSRYFAISVVIFHLLGPTHSYSSQEISAKEIIARCGEAMGGQENINALKTIRVSSVYPDHGEQPIIFEFKRPNLSRSAGGRLVFDGSRACWVRGQDGNSDPELVNADEWKDYEIDTAYLFPAFYDFPSEYRGTETYEGKECFILTVVMPLGIEMKYLIDSDTWLPVQVSTEFEFRGKEYKVFRDLFDYRKVGGLNLPHGFSYTSRDNQLKGWVTSYELNVSFPEDYFRLPVEP